MNISEKINNMRQIIDREQEKYKEIFPVMTPHRRPATLDNYLIRWAKTQEAAQSDGLISVKLLDSEGDETGDAFDVYVFPSKAATDFSSDYINSETGATLAVDDYLLIAKIGGDWVMVSPVLIKTQSITVQTDYRFSDPNFQIKTRDNVVVLGTDAESEWSTEHTGSDCS